MKRLTSGVCSYVRRVMNWQMVCAGNAAASSKHVRPGSTVIVREKRKNGSKQAGAYPPARSGHSGAGGSRHQLKKRSGKGIDSPPVLQKTGRSTAMAGVSKD